MTDHEYMSLAYDEAKKAAERGEVPVGAVIVRDGQIIATAKNNREETGDATGHAEMIAIREACSRLGGWHLTGCTLYVTLEPCPMCAGAILNARVGCVYFALKDANAGALGSVLNLNSYPLLHKVRAELGECEEESRELLSSFFKARR